MKIVPVKPGMTSIPLGRQGENLRTQIVFPVQEWLEEYPEASIGLINRRPDENTEYPVLISGIEDGTVKWTVGAAELANDGDGECTLIAMEGEVVVKSKNYKTVVFRSLAGEGDAPDPWESWIEYFEELKDDAEEAAEAAETAAENSNKVVIVSDTQPQDEPYNKLWIKEQAEQEYTVPLYSEFEALAGEVDDKYEKPESGIPATDLAAGVIPDITGKLDKPATPGTSGQVLTSDGQGGQSWQDASGGSIIPVFTNTNDQWSCNMTFSEVMSALQENNCEGCLINGSLFAPVTYFYDDPYEGNIQFSCVDMLGTNKFIMKMITYMVGEYIDYFERQSNTLDALAKKYSSSDSSIFPVSVGDYYAYNGKLYKANTAIQTAESFKPAKWDEVKVTGELNNLKNEIDDKQDAPATAGTAGQVLGLDSNLDPVWVNQQGGGGGAVQDVQINGTSILSQGVANIPVADASNYGAVKVDGTGIKMSSGILRLESANATQAKSGGSGTYPLTPVIQHNSVFYGLAKAAGDTSQGSSSNAVGTYTESAKSAIASMLDAPETVSGTTPSITAKAGVRYICGEISTLTIVAPASGCIDVIFTSGSTPTVLTVSSAKTGVTAIKWANGFDPTSLDANTVYEINILDGEFGVVGSWT